MPPACGPPRRHAARRRRGPTTWALPAWATHWSPRGWPRCRRASTTGGRRTSRRSWRSAGWTMPAHRRRSGPARRSDGRVAGRGRGAGRGRRRRCSGRGEEAARRFAAGLALDPVASRPFERARLELAAGAHLRRTGHRRGGGRRAERGGLGASTLWGPRHGRRCARELDACGLRPRRRAPCSPATRPHRPGAPRGPPRGRRTHQPRGRGRAGHHHQDGRAPPRAGLRQAGPAVAQRAGGPSSPWGPTATCRRAAGRCRWPCGAPVTEGTIGRRGLRPGRRPGRAGRRGGGPGGDLHRGWTPRRCRSRSSSATPGWGKTSPRAPRPRALRGLGVVAEGDPAESDLEYGVLEQLGAPLAARRVRGRRRSCPWQAPTPWSRGGAPALRRRPRTRPAAGRRGRRRALGRSGVARRDDLRGPPRAGRPGGAVPDVPARGPRPRKPAGLARLVVPAQRRIDLGPLDSAAVAELASRSIGGPCPRRPSSASGPTRAATRCTSERAARARPGRAGRRRTFAGALFVHTLVLGRLAACRPPAQRLVEALAVLDRRPAVTTAMAVAGLDPAGDDDGVAALDEAMETGFVELVERPGERSLVFTHPLVAAAVSGDMSPSRRAELQLAAGAVVPGVAGMRHRLDGCRDTTLAWPQTPRRRRPRRSAGRAPRGPLVGRGGRVAPTRRDREQGAAAVRRPPPVGGRSRRRRPRPPAGRRRGRRASAVVRARPARVRARPAAEAEGHLDRAWHQVDVAGDRGVGRPHRRAPGDDGGRPGRRCRGLVWARRALSLAWRRRRRLPPRPHAGDVVRPGGARGEQASPS